MRLSTSRGAHSRTDEAHGGTTRAADLLVSYDSRGLTVLAAARDPDGAPRAGVRRQAERRPEYRVEGGDWLNLYQGDPVKTEPAACELVFSHDEDGTVLKSTLTFRTNGRVMDRTIDVANRTQEPIAIGDFALSLPWRAPGSARTRGPRPTGSIRNGVRGCGPDAQLPPTPTASARTAPRRWAGCRRRPRPC
jgi:hypothetical protein